MTTLPTGTVIFLFTDIEGSTKLWEQHREQMQAAVARHDAILRRAIEAHGGYVFKTVGDAFCAAFSTPRDALQSAFDAQRELHAEQWDRELGAIRVRMALHVGIAQERDGDYFGPPVNRVARLLSAGHGAQTLLSSSTYDLLRDALPPGVQLQDMGEHRLKDLQRPERIFQLAAPGLPSEFPPLRTLDYRPNNLPRQATAFIGREKELEAVSALLGHHDATLVTLTGPGGTGKTRLALQAAAEMLDDFTDGVFSVELAALLDASLVPFTIAQALGVIEAAGKPIIDSLKDYLKDKQMVLVLDNFEHMVPAASIVDTLLKGSAGLKVLATSRVGLHLYGEKEFPVPPFSLPDTRHMPPLERLLQYEAVHLFMERAQDVKPDFAVTRDNAPAIAEICARLDGLPLAIELAAARIKLFPPQALLQRLSSRLKILTGGASNLPARQQTLNGAIAWSYDLLDAGEKQLFHRMAVFQGGRTLEGLEAVCNYDGKLQVDVLEGVASLVGKSLLQQREGSDGEPRFWMLETIQEYAWQKLEESGEGGELQEQHARYFLALAEEAGPQLEGARAVEWYARLEDEHDNMRMALRWAKAAGEGGEVNRRSQESGGDAGGDHEIGLRLCGALQWFWLVRGYVTEGREHLQAVLSTTSRKPDLQSAGSAHLDTSVSAPESSALDVYRARALSAAGLLAMGQGDYAIARSFFEESLAAFRELGPAGREGASMCLYQLGSMAFQQVDIPAALALHEEGLALRREAGDRSGIAWSLYGLGQVAYLRGDYESAYSLQRESATIFRELGNKRGLGQALISGLGQVAFGLDDLATMRSVGEEALPIFRELGDKRGIALTLLDLAAVALGEGNPTGARTLLSESLTLCVGLGFKVGIAYCLEGAAGVAWGLSGVGYSHKELTTGARAQPEPPDQDGTASKAEAHLKRATRLYAATAALREAIGAPRPPAQRTSYERYVASARVLLSEEVFDKVWAEGQALSIEEAVAYALDEALG